MSKYKNYIRNRHGRIVQCTSAEHAALAIAHDGAVAALDLEVEAHLKAKAKRRDKGGVRALAEKRVALAAAASRAAEAAPDAPDEDGADEDGEGEEAAPVVPRASAEGVLKSKNKTELVSLAARFEVEGVSAALKVDEIRHLLALAIMSGAIPLHEAM